jgi:hypothetical protein
MRVQYFLHLFLFFNLALSASICYFPNGDTSTDVPCDAEAPFTQCCGTRSACLSNGLCALKATNDTGTAYARGTCTDRSWASPLCPQQCQLNQDTPINTTAYDFRASGVQVWQCGSEGFARDAKFCCESEAESKRCCSTQTALFTLLSASVGPSTSIKTTQSSTSTALSSTIGPGPTRSEGVPANTSPPATSAPTPKRRMNTAVSVGAGVGGTLIVLVLIAGVIFCMRKRKHKKQNMAKANDGQQEITMAEENKHPYELATHPIELPPQPHLAWELPGNPPVELPADPPRGSSRRSRRNSRARYHE